MKTFQKENRRQGYLLVLFIILMGATFYIFYTGREKPGEVVVSPTIERPFRTVKIDFDFLDKLEQVDFTDFSKIADFEEVPGRENPFVQYDAEEEIEED